MKQPWWGYKIALKPVEKLGEVIKLVTIYVNMLFFHELFIFPLSQGKYSQKNKLLWNLYCCNNECDTADTCKNYLPQNYLPQINCEKQLWRVKRSCVFEHSVMTNFNCACPAIQRGLGSGFLSEGSSWLTACMSEQRMFWWDCADAHPRRLAWTFAARMSDKYQIHLTWPNSGPYLFLKRWVRI